MSYSGRRHLEYYPGYASPRPRPLKALRRTLLDFRAQWLTPPAALMLAMAFAIDTAVWLYWR